MSDLAALRTDVRRRLGELTPDFWVDAEIDVALNEAQRRFAQEERWAWLLTSQTDQLANGASSFDLGTGIFMNRWSNLLLTGSGDTYPYQPKRLTTAQGFQLKPSYTANTGSYAEFYYLAMSTQEAVVGYGAHVVTVNILPTLNRITDYEFVYHRTPEELVDEDDVPDVPEEYQSALVAWATAQLWFKELRDGGTKAQEQFSLYNKVLEQARAEYARPAQDDVMVWGAEQPQNSERQGTFPRQFGTRLGP